MRQLDDDGPRSVRNAYAGDEERPLGGYLAALGTYAAGVGALAGAARLRGRRLPEKFSLGDTVLLSIATHKLSRLVAKDAVTSPLRAPFTRYEEPAGDGEVNESVRGHGIRHSVGELISCPFCMAVWIATALTGGMVLAPRLTRAVTVVMTAVASSDLLQLVYDSAKELPSAVGAAH
ncbi:MAG TPA: DUF1360 domain-containing protein [Pseudonocardiaceae bacterium]|jgi:hypothetical protein|nr:DUF1360 domain-containing protein [Pseudonocardiaceae bacterium]